MYHCIVGGCTSAHTHITRAHMCGRCGIRGHGVMECGNEMAVRRLRDSTRHHHISAGNRCTVPGCRHPTDHMAEWHRATTTQPRLPTLSIARFCPMCRAQVAYHHTIYIPGEIHCVVCMQCPITILFWPCKHACVCDACNSKIL